MTKTSIIVLAVAFGLAFVGMGCTEEASRSTPDNANGTGGKLKRFTGEVTSIDTTARTITVKRTKDEGSFDVSSLSIARSIRVGKKVTVSYYEQDGNRIAKSVKPAKAKRTKKKRGESTGDSRNTDRQAGEGRA